MFIKILTPNHNGKIELTVKDLEALIQEAVDKAIREKCCGCTRGYYYGGGITYLNSGTSVNSNIRLDSDSTLKCDPYKITCSSECVSDVKTQADSQAIKANDTYDTYGITLTSIINDVIGE